MAKVSFSKVENSFTDALRKILIDRLFDLAVIVTLINDPRSKIPPKIVKQLIDSLQTELKTLKEKDIKLYQRLELTPEQEVKFYGSYTEFSSEDWDRLRLLKERIEELKGELYGLESPKPEYEEQVNKERLKHINKRFNIREGWLPLH